MSNHAEKNPLRAHYDVRHAYEREDPTNYFYLDTEVSKFVRTESQRWNSGGHFILYSIYFIQRDNHTYDYMNFKIMWVQWMWRWGEGEGGSDGECEG